MTEKHKRGPDGQLQDDVSSYPITMQDRALYQQAQDALSRLPAPALYHKSHPHERLFIAHFDGTGNDAGKDPEHMTNVGSFWSQLHLLSKTDRHVQAGYVPGPGTQSNPLVRIGDSMLGFTYDARLEEMYEKFIRQAREWLQEDPQAQIRIVGTGFSRGAEQEAGFSRLVHERGIQDISGMVVHHHLAGPDTVTYTKPPLVPPRKVMQAVALFDPVGEGVPQERNRQLPSSVISGFQITARDERRNLFPSTQMMPQGLSADGRFLGVTVPGAHSDIGGSYHLNGLSTLNGNLMTDYINALSDTPLLHKRALPQDPQMYVIHRSEEHLAIYRTSAFDHEGQRDVMGAQVSPPHCRRVLACALPEPLAPALAAQLPARAPVTIGPLPAFTVSTVKRDVAYANAQTVREREPLPPGGLPVQVERKPNPLPAPAPTHTHERTSAPAVPPHPAEPAHAAHTLQAGDHGPAVQSLQNHLRNLGYTDMRGRPLPADGHYGPITQVVVQGFQQEHGLAVDGRAGPQTQAALQRQIQHTHAPIMARQASAPVTTPSTPTHTESQASMQLARQQADEAARAAQQVRLQQQIAHQHRVAAEEKETQRATEARIAEERTTPPAEPAPIPENLRDFRHPDHPMHKKYQRTLDEVHRMEEHHNVPHSEHSERLAAALVDTLHKERFGALDKLELRGRGEGMQVVAHQDRPNVYMPEREVSVHANQATARSVEAVTHDWSRRAMPHLHEPAPAMAPDLRPDPRTLPAHDPRHPEHPQHPLYQRVHAQVADAYAKAGVPRSATQLEHATAATMLQAQIHQLDGSTPYRLSLAQDRVTGVIGPDSHLTMRAPDRVFGHMSHTVSAQTLQQAPEASFQEMRQVAQTQAKDWQEFQMQTARANAQQHLYPTAPGMPGGGPGGGR